MGLSKSLSVVVPCLNEEEVIHDTLRRLTRVIDDNFSNWRVEIILVDDGSTDATVEFALKFSLPVNATLRVLRFTRNFGHQAAISAGIAEARAQVVAVIDADLQDPPELIPSMVAALAEGFDVVSGQRTSRKGVPAWKRSSYSAFYRMMRAVVSDLDIPLDTGDFRVLSRRAVDALVAMPEKNRFVRGLLPYTGLPHTSIEYERQPRQAGEPKYTIGRLLRLAFDGLFSFSTRPLRVAFYLGAGLFVLSILAAAIVIVDRLLTDDWAPGWAGTLVVVLSFGGIQFFFLGIIGEYIGKIFDEVKNRPAYVILEELTSGGDPLGSDALKEQGPHNENTGGGV